MKWLVMMLVLACAKPDPAAAYRDEAVALVAYYRPIADAFTRRVDKIRERGLARREPVPGATATTTQLNTAIARIGELRGLIDGLDQRSAGADATLVAEARLKLDATAEQITYKLNAVEAWEAEAESVHAAPADQAATPP